MALDECGIILVMVINDLSLWIWATFTLRFTLIPTAFQLLPITILSRIDTFISNPFVSIICMSQTSKIYLRYISFYSSFSFDKICANRQSSCSWLYWNENPESVWKSNFEVFLLIFVTQNGPISCFRTKLNYSICHFWRENSYIFHFTTLTAEKGAYAVVDRTEIETSVSFKRYDLNALIRIPDWVQNLLFQ